MEFNNNLNYPETVFEYQIVEFIMWGPKSTRKTDVVPISWMNYNKKTVQIQTKFLPKPYTEETCALLHHLVKNNVEPLDRWPEYNVKLVGQASKYYVLSIPLSFYQKKLYKQKWRYFIYCLTFEYCLNIFYFIETYEEENKKLKKLKNDDSTI